MTEVDLVLVLCINAAESNKSSPNILLKFAHPYYNENRRGSAKSQMEINFLGSPLPP